MYEELSIDQPLPEQFQDATDTSGGCKAGGAVGVILVIIIMVVFFVTIMKNK